MTTKLLLKDQLFNGKKVKQIAEEIRSVYTEFNSENFIKTTTKKIPELELKQRIRWIRENLQVFLPQDFRTAATILLESLPPVNDPSKTDNDFGDFIYAPHAEFIAVYGCNNDNLHFSLACLKEITKRFSAEDAIRYFINTFPKETMTELYKWSTDSHYHVRRLTSEGTRPKLPWAQKIRIPIESTLPILNNLFSDDTRFVTRSVANHLNDISKINPDLTLKTLDSWQTSGRQNQKEMEYIINHSVRNLVKQGYPPVFAFLNFSNTPSVIVSDFKMESIQIKLGGVLEFSFSIEALKNENFLIDYIISFQNKKGEMKSKKVFKLKKIEMQKGQHLTIRKRHQMKEHMTTRTIYIGKHNIEIQLNGNIKISKLFEVIN